MAQVPDTTTFCLSDVTNIVGGTSLSAAFTNANASYFDPTYGGDCTCLLNFRNYTEVVTINICNQFTYCGQGECMNGTVLLRCYDTHAQYDSAIVDSSSSQHFSFTNVPAGTYYVDFSAVYSYLAGTPVATYHCWGVNYGSCSFGSNTSPFSSNSTVEVWVFDNIF